MSRSNVAERGVTSPKRTEWDAVAPDNRPTRPRDEAPSVEPPSPARTANLVVGGAVLAAAFAWAYWPTLGELVNAWDRIPDYSHGYLVAPLAVFFLWARRDRLPEATSGLAWPGLLLLGAAVGVRVLGAHVFLDAADGWSMMLWAAGLAWLFWGRRVFWWSLPSIAFLWFMIPLPYRVERLLSWPLQKVATKLSCVILQCLGQPAFDEGNTILMGPNTLEVADACSGLRIFVGIFALAFAYIIVVRKSWWERGLLLVAVVPVALIANSTRIVCTGLLYQWASGEAAQQFSHDVAGKVMIPYAAGLFALVLWYMSKLMREVEPVRVGAVIKQEREPLPDKPTTIA
ncbi:MAG: exosortase/archaeosortase family protein [Candidatus Nealsonbacteria bacterium]|nr:exosortase/archaeosortase family protein [Candidatus Nealsonbacteria bacterium]